MTASFALSGTDSPNHYYNPNEIIMSSSKPTVVPAIQSLRTTFMRIFGNLPSHADYDHRAATSMAPKLLRNPKDEYVDRDRITGLIHNSPKLATWAHDPPSSSSKLLIIRLHPLLEGMQPRGWHTAEILTQSLPDKIHGRQVIILQYWCRSHSFSALLPSLIMQLIKSPVFDNCSDRELNLDSDSMAAEPYDLHKLEKYDREYLMNIFHHLLEVLDHKEVIVYCVLDSFDHLEQRILVTERDDLLACLFDEVRRSAIRDESVVDFRLLLMGPRFNHDGKVEFMQSYNSGSSSCFLRTLEYFGVVLDCHRRFEQPQSAS